jgi:hypothetical protein
MLGFWHNLWCGNTTLKEASLVLFGIACASDAFVTVHVDFLEVPFSGM